MDILTNTYLKEYIGMSSLDKRRITKHVRRKNALSVSRYYATLGKSKSVFTSPTSSIARDYTKVAMHSPDTRTFQGEKVTLEEIENWKKNNLVKKYNQAGKRI